MAERTAVSTGFQVQAAALAAVPKDGAHQSVYFAVNFLADGLRRFFLVRRLGLFDGPQTADLSIDIDQLTGQRLELTELGDLAFRVADGRLRRQVLGNGLTVDFVGELRMRAVSGVLGFGAMTPGHVPEVVSTPGPARRWLLLSAGAVAALVATALVVMMFAPRQRAAKPIESLAVLPLENLSHDAEQDYFADGMTDELITDLAKISALRVISRTSVMQYKGTKKPVPQIARELNVDAVLEGTVLRDRGRVRITAQLIGAEPEKHLWAEKYEGSLSEVLTLQDAVSKAVARQIQIKVTPREQALLATRRAVDPEAYEAYLRASI